MAVEPAALTQAVREVRRFDRGAVSVVSGLVAAIPVVAVFGGALAASQPAAAATMGAGAMLVGVAWRTSGGRPPLALMACDAVALALGTLIACSTGATLALHLVVLFLFAAVCGLLFAVQRRAAVVGTQAIIAFVVFGRFPKPLHGALALAGLVLAGGAAQVLFAALMRWPAPLRAQRQAVARAYDALAEFATLALPSSGIPAAAALDAAQDMLASPTLFGDPAILRLRTIVDEGRRVRLELNAIRILLRQISRAQAPDEAEEVRDEAVVALLALVGEALTSAARSLCGEARAAARFEAATRHISGVAKELGAALVTASPDAVREHLGERFAALAGQLRVLAGVLPGAGSSGRLILRRPQAGVNRPLEMLRSDIDQMRANASLRSPAGRHALRLALVVVVTELIARYIPLARSYWMVVAAAAVLRPDFGATFTRGAERTLGTFGGVVIAGLITVGLDPGPVAAVVLVGVLSWASYALFPASYAAGFAFNTTLVVFLLEVVSPDTLSTAVDRGIDTALGAAIGLLAYVVWPTWSRTPVRQSLGELVEAQRVYLEAVLASVVDGRRARESAMRPLARRARLARTDADAAVATALGEPVTRRIDAGHAQAILAALRRLVEATHVLRIDAQHDRRRAPEPALAPFVAEVDGALGAIGEAIVTGEPWCDGEPVTAALRDRYDQFARASGDAVDGLLGPELDEIVDAVNSVRALVGGSDPLEPDG